MTHFIDLHSAVPGSRIPLRAGCPSARRARWGRAFAFCGALVIAGHALSAPAPQIAQTACTGLAFSAFPSTVAWFGRGGAYSIFDAADHIQSVAFAVTKQNGACTYFVTATAIGPDTVTSRRLRSGNGALNFNIYADSTRANIIRDLPAVGQGDFIAGSFGPGGRATNRQAYYFDIAPRQMAAPGAYQAALQFKLFQGTPANNVFVQSVQVLHRASVGPEVQISAVPRGQSFNQALTSAAVNLGALNAATGPITASLDLRVRGNGNYQVMLQSQNRGVLRLADSSDTSALPYRLTIDGVPANLSGARMAFVARSTGIAAIGGAVLPIVVTLDAPPGTIENSQAGDYSDVLSVSVTSE